MMEVVVTQSIALSQLFCNEPPPGIQFLQNKPTQQSQEQDKLVIPDRSTARAGERDDPGPKLSTSEASILLIAKGSAPLTITDDLANDQHLEITIRSCQNTPVTYHWLPQDQKNSQNSPSRSIVAKCDEPGGSIVIRCAQQTFGSQKAYLVTKQEHTASHTSSEVQIHGVSGERSRMDVQSLIYIAPGICGIKAHQIHKHLLLDQGARATSEPMLEVLSDDVSCSHGAAIRYLDEQQIFYLQSRGCPKEQAQKMLVNAFLQA